LVACQGFILVCYYKLKEDTLQRTGTFASNENTKKKVGDSPADLFKKDAQIVCVVLGNDIV
jgi:hypothetical protein